jgi:hypothetical protein
MDVLEGPDLIEHCAVLAAVETTARRIRQRPSGSLDHQLCAMQSGFAGRDGETVHKPNKETLNSL